MRAAKDAAAPHRFEALDSLRGVCACMLVLYHLVTEGAIHAAPIVQSGFLFVDFFFVLSGFVIAASYGERLRGGMPIARFMVLRLGRIYPLHLVVLAAFVAFELAFLAMPSLANGRRPFAYPYDPGSLVACLLLIQPFVGPDGTPWNGPSWSIAVELWTYLVFAFVFRWAGRRTVPVALAIAAGSALYLLRLTDRYINVFHDGAMARCLLGFALGVAAFPAHRRLEALRLPALAATLLEIAIVAATVLAVAGAGATPWSLALPLVFFLAILVFAREGGRVSRLLRLRPFLMIGAASYSIYMIHLFFVYRLTNVFQLVQRLSHGRLDIVSVEGGHAHVGGGALFGDVVSVVGLALVIAAARLSYRWIERPAQAWSRRLVLGRHPRVAAIAAEREAPTF